MGEPLKPHRALRWPLKAFVALALIVVTHPLRAATITDPVAANSVPGTGAITPLKIAATTISGAATPNAVTIGPQTILVTLVNSYDSTYALDFDFTISNAAFTSTGYETPYDLTSKGALTVATTTGCTLSLNGTNATVSNCSASGTSHVRALALTASYDDASALGTAGSTITLTVNVVSHANPSTVYESASATIVVKSTGVSAVHIANVYSSSQSASQSFLRFYNGSSSAGTIGVTLSDSVSGTTFAQWTSPSIPSSASPQYGIGEIEQSAPSGSTKPALYSVTVTPTFTGAVQHVVWRPQIGTITDQSICDSGAAQAGTLLTNVHSSVVAGYPSTIVVYNTGSSAAAATLQIANGTTGQSLGSYATAQIPANGQLAIAVATIESAAGIVPTSGPITYYNVSISGQFTGFLEHLVTNQISGVVSDMTPVCSFAGSS